MDTFKLPIIVYNQCRAETDGVGSNKHVHRT